MTLLDIPDDHQAADIDTALRFVDRFDCAIDCGAHRGVITRQLAKRFKSVTAIEPGPLADKIEGATVVRAALADKPGRCALEDGKVNTGQLHVIDGDAVEVITLDSLGLSPDFIKIDVEGMEWHTIKGGEETIRRCKPVIMLEENGLNRRYGIPDGGAGALLESWGAVRVMVLTAKWGDQDWIYKWPR